METQLVPTERNTGGKPNARSTEQRRIILKIIQQAGGHLDADDIYRLARKDLPVISLSTVYRTLQLFRKSGLIEEHQFSDMRRRYETVPSAKHHHLVCLGCGRVLEFNCPSTERLKSRISRQEGFEVTDAEVRLEGYCPECKKRLSDRMTDTKQDNKRRR